MRCRDAKRQAKRKGAWITVKAQIRFSRTIGIVIMLLVHATLLHNTDNLGRIGGARKVLG